MKCLVLLIACIPAVAFADDELCGSWRNPIVLDMRILESQLTADSASKAKVFLEKHGEKGNDDFEFGRENARKKIKGYALKQAAQNGGKTEVEVFCRWLTTEGFWHD